MIYGQSEQGQETALNFVQKSTILFYLTGSRFFGNVKETSDWDFFAQGSNEIENHLNLMGWEVESESYAGDPLICKVYKKENVHIQLVKDARAKAWIQYLLLPMFRVTKPDKEMAKRLWSLATKLYNGGFQEALCRRDNPLKLQKQV